MFLKVNFKDQSSQIVEAIVSIYLDSETYLLTVSHVVNGKVIFSHFRDWSKIEIEET